MAISYPAIPNFYDPEAVMQATQRGYQAGVDYKNEKNAAATFGKYLESLYGGQGSAPQTLSSLRQQFTAPAPGTVQRAPLPAPLDPASARVEQAFAAQGQGTSPDAIAGRFLKTVRDGGLTNPYALAAVAATGKNESGYAADKAFGTWSDPSQSGQAGTSGGILSWRADRLANLQKFAADNGDDPNRPSPETQGKFLLAEDPSLIQRLQAAKSPQEASSIMANAWKFAGYNQPGGEAAQRAADTQTYLPQFSGGAAPSQQALQNLAVGQSIPTGAPTQVADASGAVPAPQGGSILPPREVMGELFANPVTRPFAVDLAKAAQAVRIDANDPEKQVQLQLAKAKLAAALDPSSKAKYGNSVVWGQDASGKWVALQPSSSGGLEMAQTPEGVTLSPPGVSNLNLGTQYGIRDRNGQVVNTVPIDNSGKASDTALGKSQGEARATLASMQAKLPGLEQVVGELEDLSNKATYTSAGKLIDWTRKEAGAQPRDAAIARTAYISKVSNQILPLLRDTFGAQFTAREGDTLMATLGDPDKSPPEKQAVLKSFIEQKRRDIEALARQTGQEPTGGAATDFKAKYGLD